jgi:hypothetical protein
MKNKTLTKNMPNVKWDQLPPKKGPNSQGIKKLKVIKNVKINKFSV